jgi:tetraprenyl-beta-curcumene synthase
LPGRGDHPGGGCPARAFVATARVYWLEVWPILRRELSSWRRHAESIPDASLRHVALRAQRAKRRNLEGAIAFATLTRPEHRLRSAQAMAAYEAAFDFLDCLCEMPNSDPVGNGRQLMQALTIAVQPGRDHDDYYARCEHPTADSGYLQMLVGACQRALAPLPSYPVVSAGLLRVSKRIETYQSLNHGGADGSHHAFARWASREAAHHQASGNGPELYWWEMGAAGGSSLAAFALIAAAADPATESHQVGAIDSAYFPWIGATNSLLDSLIDQAEDAAPGQHRLLDYYDSAEQLAARLELITGEARQRAQAVDASHGHTLILAAMMSFYLTQAEARLPDARQIRDRLRRNGTSRGFDLPCTLVMRARNLVAATHALYSKPSDVAT